MASTNSLFLLLYLYSIFGSSDLLQILIKLLIFSSTIFQKSTPPVLKFFGGKLFVMIVLTIYTQTLSAPRRTIRSWGGGGWWVTSSNRLIGMCHWVGSHFGDWMDYNKTVFS